MNRARAVLTALVLASALSLAGCSDDDPEPTFAPPSSEPPESPSTTAASAGDSPDAAFAVWVEARNDALATGDTALVRALSSPGCKTCEDTIAPIEQVYEAGGHFETDGWSVVSMRVKSEGEDRAQVSAAIKYEAGQTLPSASADPVSYDVEKHIVLIDLVAANGAWLVDDLVYLS